MLVLSTSAVLPEGASPLPTLPMPIQSTVGSQGGALAAAEEGTVTVAGAPSPSAGAGPGSTGALEMLDWIQNNICAPAYVEQMRGAITTLRSEIRVLQDAPTAGTAGMHLAPAPSPHVRLHLLENEVV